MKRTVLISSIIISTFLNAQEIKTSTEITKAFDSKNYEKVYETLNKKTKTAVLTSNEYFILGRSAYELGRYNEAILNYQMILQEEPSNRRVQLEIAQSYEKLGNLREAKEIFLSVLDTKVPAQVKENIILKLNSIETRLQKSVLKLETLLSLSYDSNVKNQADKGSYSLYIPAFGDLNITDNTEKEGDTLSELVGLLTHTYRVNNKIDIQNKLTAYTQRYFSHSENNINLLSWAIEPSYQLDKSKLSVELYKDFIQVGNRNYQTNTYLKPKVTYNLSQNSNYIASFKLNKKSYLQSSNKDRGSYEYTFANTYSIYDETYGLNSFTLEVGLSDRRKGTRTDVNNSFYTLRYVNRYPLEEGLVLSNYLEYKDTSYKDTDVNFRTKREDKNYFYSIELTKSLKNNISVGGSWQYINRESNHKPFEYDKMITKLFLYYPF
ncbi:tetratricopeptide repeat protein [Halarcobacter ebronensis]|uniref:Uncharacterized protein n=1 Tax=Halarcobacter ebronensis TaxID=1462615 RepID=A0A4Q1ANA0_9BACT|nr:tetratricopeptide repeat protein [Halarcobacter ebronensis]QKF82380.1 tetratricopeptide repeat protein [Halarcobacter ebronensis]RXK07594.1 hypothetical protein CRV07_03795 [Halarcobacter ebronensis]